MPRGGVEKKNRKEKQNVPRGGVRKKKSVGDRLEFLRTTILANSSRSVLRKQFCNVSSQERSVFGVNGVKWHRPTSAFP